MTGRFARSKSAARSIAAHAARRWPEMTCCASAFRRVSRAPAACVRRGYPRGSASRPASRPAPAWLLPGPCMARRRGTLHARRPGHALCRSATPSGPFAVASGPRGPPSMQLLRLPSPSPDAGPSPAARSAVRPTFRPTRRAFSQAVAGLLNTSSSPVVASPGLAVLAVLAVSPVSPVSRVLPPEPTSTEPRKSRQGNPWLPAWRDVFANERTDHVAALQQQQQQQQQQQRASGAIPELDEMSRSMGLSDCCRTVLSTVVVRKQHFVHRIVAAAAQQEQTCCTR